MKYEERMKAFLDDLYAITLKHKVAVDGCGCCESPFLSDVSDIEDGVLVHNSGDRLEFIERKEAEEIYKRDEINRINFKRVLDKQ